MGAASGASAIGVAEFCALLRAVARRPPRLSRDLEPDLIGIDLKQQILDALIADPPAPADFEAGLLERADALDLATGAARGVCSDILAEWRMAHTAPAFLPWLRDDAGRRRRREERDGEPSWRQRPDRGFGLPPTDGG
jgi:hypothetical protein